MRCRQCQVELPEKLKKGQQFCSKTSCRSKYHNEKNKEVLTLVRGLNDEQREEALTLLQGIKERSL